MESPQSNARTKRARRNFSGGSRQKDRLQAFAGLQFGAGKTGRKGYDHRWARGLGTAWDNRAVIRVVADLPGWMEYLPRRSAQEPWWWPRVSEVVVFSSTAEETSRPD